ncbi:hypothetical protein EPUS_02599 [Endocarpon pusillum Z07020]|uniref:SprT-like domain-containing protein n=1 Tax=Endocarpon pusillum (strain Z07020 / HMAS-L-300199) TaxID=1263415 RepID=U1GWL7_ENDPU|nr:uncharacterized protein EPUS_02599 [Endocarpon pusillum Z07020]ERF76888.1 hypothetical protein EPUS_02599 [Endocarpon pusillum Z07020]
MQYAHHQEDLEANLVVGEPGYEGICNLDNDIHPIWRRENFRVADIADEARLLRKNHALWDRYTLPLEPKIYQRIEPGLRLASLLLQQSAPFFSQVLYGTLQPRRVRRLHPLGEVDQWRYRWVDVIGKPHFSKQEIAAQLNRFAEHVAEKSLIYLSSHTSLDNAWGETRTQLNERNRYAVGIGLSLGKVICQPQWNKCSAQTRRYYNFQLATTLVHELAHVAWICRCWDDFLEDPELVREDEEAIFSPSEVQMELGQSWENWFFGCELRPIEAEDTTPPKWLGYACSPFTLDSGNPGSIQYRNSRYGATAIPAKCINQFFQKGRWAAHMDGYEHFSIHLTPLNSLCNDVWNDDLDDGFMTRMTLNHENRIDPAPSFRDTTLQT